MKNWKPIFVENSWVPKALSVISPISIGAITLGFIVFARDEMTDRTKQHETIHFQQCLELLFIGAAMAYVYDWLKGYIKYKDGKEAYYRTRAEQEAYDNEYDKDYLQNRKRWEWLRKYKV